MAFGVFVHRSDSRYDDSPAERYQFPKQYLSRAEACAGDWIIYYEPVKATGTRGYFAVAKVERIIPDPGTPNMHLALIEAGSYLDFAHNVPFSGPTGVVERGILNEEGRISGRAQSAVRPLSPQDFNRIIDLGLARDAMPLPRDATLALQEEPQAFLYEQPRDRISSFTSRIVRDRIFRHVVLRAYDERCALTGLRLINGGGRAEVEAAHIRPVDENGPDIISNGIALSGTMHWMFDRGMIGLEDDLRILVSRQVNDPDSVRTIVNKNGYAMLPRRASERPHPHFLRWHREHRFKS